MHFCKQSVNDVLGRFVNDVLGLDSGATHGATVLARLGVWTFASGASEPRSGGSPVATGVKPVDPHCQAVERQRRDRR